MTGDAAPLRAMLAAETEYLEELIRRGILPAGARREPTSRELRAGVRFAELDRIVLEATGLLTRTMRPVLELLLTELPAVLSGARDQYAVLAALEQLRPEDVPGLSALIEETVDAMTDQLAQVAQAGAAEAISEATRQGVPARLIPAIDADTEEVRAAAAAHARRAVNAQVARALAAATEEAARAATLGDATTATVIDAASSAAGAATQGGAEDLARQAANVAHGLGRRDAQTALPEPDEVYASELLDRNTCGPCATVDGTEYGSLEEGLADYPGAGGYYACDGGSRCRGTLVIVWPQEVDATRERPGR